MTYKTLKKFYCPFRGRRVEVGELIEIPEQYLKGYLPYIETKAVEPPKVELPKVELPKVEPKKKKK